FEEQLRRYTHLSSAPTYVDKPKEEKKESAKVDGKESEEGQTNGDTKDDGKKENGNAKEKEANGDMNSEDKENDTEQVLNPSIQRVANQLEDLLIDMKSDCARIPQTVQRIPSIANRLQIGPRSKECVAQSVGYGRNRS